VENVILLPVKYTVTTYDILLTYDVIDVNECFHDFMFVNRALPPAPLR
jgi:hypothetical protein